MMIINSNQHSFKINCEKLCKFIKKGSISI